MKRYALLAILLIGVITLFISNFNRQSLEYEPPDLGGSNFSRQMLQVDAITTSLIPHAHHVVDTTTWSSILLLKGDHFSLNLSLVTTTPAPPSEIQSFALYANTSAGLPKSVHKLSGSSFSEKSVHQSRSPRSDDLVKSGNVTAICLVGYGRSLKFPGLRQRLRTHVFGHLGIHAKLFALIWLDTDKHPLITAAEEKRLTAKSIHELLPSRHSLAQLEFHSQALSQDVPNINDRCEAGWQSRKVASARRYKVGATSILQMWLAQWGKLSTCLHMVESYEYKQQVKFEYVMRLRPDMLFLQDIGQPNEILGKASIAVPLGIGGKHKFNDHAVLCRRPACSAYFFPTDDYRKCRGNFKDQFQYDLSLEDGVQAPAQNRIKRERWNVVHSRAFIYTLMRDRTKAGNPGCSADCMRLAEKNAHTDFFSECLMVEKAVCLSAYKKV